MFALIGGYMGMVTKLSGWSLRKYQVFTIDKSMIKKLFSRKGKERNNFTCFGKEDDEVSVGTTEDLNEKQ